MDENDKRLARELLMKSKIYRLLAVVFVVAGLVVFLGIYAQYYQADILQALHDPFIIIFIVFPFIPTILLSMKARKAEGDLKKLLDDKGVKAKS